MLSWWNTVEKDGEILKENVEKGFNTALGKIVNPIVECTDVDGIVRRIHVNNVVERIDVNEFFNRVDLNQQLARVDVNAILQRVDIDALIERSNLAAIVAQSSSGVFTGVMDTMRVEIVYVDLGMLRLFQCNRKIIPPAPGKVDTHQAYPDSKMEKAIAVQEHYCGFFSKGLSIFIDWMLMEIVLAITSIIAQAFYLRIDQLFIKSEAAEETFAEFDSLWSAISTICIWFLYFWLAVALPGQTFGMAIAGVRVVQANGNKDVPWTQAALRTAALGIVVLCWPITMWVGIIRRDGRMPHDILCCTGMIYKWNARLASVREKSKERAEAVGQEKEDLNP